MKKKAPVGEDLSALGQGMLYEVNSLADYRVELKRLNRCIFEKIASALECLARSQGARGEAESQEFFKQLQTVKFMVINVHHLLNDYRAHQARSDIVDNLKQQLQRNKEALKALESAMGAAKQAS